MFDVLLSVAWFLSAYIIGCYFVGSSVDLNTCDTCDACVSQSARGMCTNIYWRWFWLLSKYLPKRFRFCPFRYDKIGIGPKFAMRKIHRQFRLWLAPLLLAMVGPPVLVRWVWKLLFN